MPEVTIRYKDGLFDSPGHKINFGQAIREIVAMELHIEKVAGTDPKSAQLAASDIEVRFEEEGRDDIGGRVLQIRIEAMSFPERVASRKDIVKYISMRIREHDYFPKNARGVVAHRRPFVWLVLPEAAFEEL